MTDLQTHRRPRDGMECAYLTQADCPLCTKCGYYQPADDSSEQMLALVLWYAILMLGVAALLWGLA